MVGDYVMETNFVFWEDVRHHVVSASWTLCVLNMDTLNDNLWITEIWRICGHHRFE